jgi:hypothetical protein
MIQVALLAFSLLASGCGSGFEYASHPGGIRVEDNSGELAGYWVNDVSGPLLYVPELDVYVPIHLESGKYRLPTVTTFFEDAACAKPVTFGHPEKTVLLLPNQKFYRVSDSLAAAGATAGLLGQIAPNGACAAAVTPAPPEPNSPRDVLEEVGQPRDFTALAPLRLVLPQ